MKHAAALAAIERALTVCRQNFKRYQHANGEWTGYANLMQSKITSLEASAAILQADQTNNVSDTSKGADTSHDKNRSHQVPKIS